MGATSTRSERVRAWVLLQAESAAGVAQALYEKLGHEGGNEFVVVRADVVAQRLYEELGHEGGDEYVGVRADNVAGPSEFAYNIIVPVDAESEDVLRDVVDRIREVSRVNPVIVTVDQHVPYPPHDAHGYITTTEVEAGREPVEKPGRQGASPGHNAFG